MSEWPRAAICGATPGDATVLGDPERTRRYAFAPGKETLQESSATARSVEDLLAAGFVQAPRVRAKLTRSEPGREITVTVLSTSTSVSTTCEVSATERTTAEAEHAGWFTPEVHRRIGRGTARTISVGRASNDERDARVEFTSVEARPDTAGMTEVAPGAWRGGPGAEGELLVLYAEQPLHVHYRLAEVRVIDALIEDMRKNPPLAPGAR